MTDDEIKDIEPAMDDNQASPSQADDHHQLEMEEDEVEALTDEHEVIYEGDDELSPHDMAQNDVATLVSDAVYEADTARLETHFGNEQWHEIKPQLQGYAKAMLPDALYHELASSYDGVMLIYQMMQANQEPALMNGQNAISPLVNEEMLRKMIRDPRYWRDQDPQFIDRVTAGYRQLYPE